MKFHDLFFKLMAAREENMKKRRVNKEKQKENRKSYY